MKKCEGESGMFDSLKTELLKYVWLMHQGRDITNYTADEKAGS